MKVWWGLCLLAVLLPLPCVVADGALLGSLGKYPECAQSCLTAAVPKSSCLVTDDACLCSDTSLTTGVQACVFSGCTTTQALFTQNLTQSLCGAPIRNKAGAYETLSITLLAIAGVCVIQRIFLRQWLQIGLGPDDWVMIVTFLNVLANTIIGIKGLIGNGFGRDLYTLTPKEITTFLRYFQISALFYFTQISLLKISFLLFYLRIFPTTSVRYVLWGTLVFNTMYGIAFTLVTIFMCRPVSYFWHQWDGEHEGKCANLNALTIASAVISIITDVWMLVVPLSQLKSLNLDWKKKLGIGLMFCVGTFVTIMSILRFRAVLKFGADNQNPTWDYTSIATWSVLEIDVGIICACMPAIRTLLAHLFKNVFGTIRGRTKDESNPNSEGHARSRRSKKTSAATSADRDHEEGPSSHRVGRQSIFFTSSWKEIQEEDSVELRDMDKKRGAGSTVSIL